MPPRKAATKRRNATAKPRVAPPEPEPVPQPGPEPERTGYCRVKEMGCQLDAAENGYFCGNHWRMIPTELRHLILSARNLTVSQLNTAITGCLSAIRSHTQGR